MKKQAESFAALMKNPHLLWGNVNKTDGCWEWESRVNKSGYGSIRVGPSSVLAHRAAFLLHYRYLDSAGCICHICDNPKCCNPSHLFITDHAGNMRDMKEKGRRKNINTCEKNGRSKLNSESVMVIRKLRLEGKCLATLSELYGVGKSTISRVCRMENWK